MSTVCVFILGRSLRILRPSGLASIWSRSAGKTGPDVKSATAATMSGTSEEMSIHSVCCRRLYDAPPRAGCMRAMYDDPTNMNACSNQFNGTCPSYRVCVLLSLLWFAAPNDTPALGTTRVPARLNVCVMSVLNDMDCSSWWWQSQLKIRHAGSIAETCWTP